jgi:hypothetical protein
MKRTLTLAAALALALAACTGTTDPTPEPTPEPTPMPTATAEPTAESTAEPTATPEPTASAATAVDGRFIPAENAEADALFLARDECQNLRDGYQLVYPDEWYTNTEFRDVAACSWFSPTFYETDDAGDVPDEIAITIEWFEGVYAWLDSPNRHDEGTVGGQTAVRVEFADEYFYRIDLGPPGEGPNLVARTTRDMGGDYELNKAVLDRLMFTIEFIGSVQ